jgi:hypothetical protein
MLEANSTSLGCGSAGIVSRNRMPPVTLEMNHTTNFRQSLRKV